MKQVDFQLERVQSHSISFGHERGKVDREELYPYFTVEIRGVEREVSVEANRYRHSSGMSEWRIYVREVRPGDGVGPQTMKAIREVVVPLVERWLASEAYTESRKAAFAWAIAYEVRNTNTTADYRLREALAAFSDELSDEDRERLTRAAALRMESLELLDARPAVTA